MDDAPLFGTHPQWFYACVVAGGGVVKIESHKINFREKAQSKVSSMDNVSHSPGGGSVKVSVQMPHHFFGFFALLAVRQRLEWHFFSPKKITQSSYKMTFSCGAFGYLGPVVSPVPSAFICVLYNHCMLMYFSHAVYFHAPPSWSHVLRLHAE